MSPSTLVDWAAVIASVPVGDAANGIFEYLCPLDRVRIKALLDELTLALAEKVPAGKQGLSARGAKSRRIGEIYERLLHALFENSKAVSFVKNVHTSTDEIDLLFMVQPLGFLAVPVLHRAGTHFIGEAKCHSKAPGSELFHSLVGVLSSHGARMAFLFVNCTSRKLESRARTAIQLHAARGYEIVPLGRKQINEIVAGANILKILADQHALALTAASSLEV